MGDKFILVKGEDWEGLYINGVLMRQDHNLPLTEYIPYLQAFIDIKAVWVDDEWLCQSSHGLPDNYKDVKLEKGRHNG